MLHLGILAMTKKNISSILESDQFEQIQNLHLNMVLWKRKAKPTMLRFLKTLSENYKLNLVAEYSDLDSLIESVPTPADKKLHKGYLEFLYDLRKLSDLYKIATGFEKFFIRLQSVNEIQCPKFHRDYTNFRLICTYFGAGMEWIPNEFVENIDSKDEASLSSITRKVKSYNVTIFKGVKKETSQVKALLHRSPHDHNLSNRIFLKIDTMK